MTKKVAFQGILGANSEIAALTYFKKQRVNCVPFERFEQVFQSVHSGRIEYGMIPIENSLSGSIHENYDLLLKKKVWILGEYKHHVQHHLLAKRGTKISDIHTVVSHPQALLQCAGTIRKHKKWQAQPFFDTAGAALFVAQKSEKGWAALASREAAKAHGIQVIESGIEDNQENYTRFIVITKNPPKSLKKGKHKTSIAFTLKNIPGALHKSLSVFALRDIDLLKIESRPIPGSPWEYLFYLDYSGKYNSIESQRALSHLQELTKKFRILGSYIPSK